MNRLIRSVAIGGAGAAAVGGVGYIFQQQKLSQDSQPVHLSSEWGFETRKNVLRAGSLSHSPAKQAEYYELALKSVVNSRTDLRTKSQDWLAGYGDLLRCMALARAESREASDEEILEPLEAALTIPYGNPELRAAAAAVAYQITSDARFLAAAPEQVPEKLSSEQALKHWAPFELERAKLDVSHKKYNDAMAKLLTLHQSVTSASDPLCFQASAGGYIAQILWRLGHKREARTWLEVSESKSSACQTPACRETTAMLRELLARAAKST